jgi:hypothetical protein
VTVILSETAGAEFSVEGVWKILTNGRFFDATVEPCDRGTTQKVKSELFTNALLS